VTPSKFYVVGEKGPELFFPQQPGMVLPTPQDQDDDVDAEILQMVGKLLQSRRKKRAKNRVPSMNS